MPTRKSHLCAGVHKLALQLCLLCLGGLQVLLQLLCPPGDSIELRLGALLLAALQHKRSSLWVWPHVLLTQQKPQGEARVQPQQIGPEAPV